MLIANRQEPKEVVPRKQQRRMSCCSSPRPSCLLKGPCSSDRRPKNKPSAEPLVRRDPDRICLDDGRAFLAGSISQEIESGREEKAAARARADPAG